MAALFQLILYNNVKKISSFAFLILLFSGCRYSRVVLLNSEDLNKQMSMSSEEKLKLSYNVLNQKVFLPKCVSCHGESGGVNLESYSEILKSLDLVKQSVFFTQSMPKNNFLTQEEKRLLWNWIDMDAPQQAQDPISEPPWPEPIQANYESINKNIFIPKCNSCHSTGNTGGRILLTKEDLLNSPMELVLPGNPDESGLVIAVERDDKKRMPPEKDGYAGLKDEEKIAIRKWIEAELVLHE